MNRPLVIAGSVLICVAIIIGAFGAHGIKKHVSANLLESWKTGATYQFYAGFGLLIIGLAANKFSFSLKPFYILTLVGVVIFSGGIYLYCISEMVPTLKVAVRFVPIGGLTLISAWLIFIIQMIRSPKTDSGS